MSETAIPTIYSDLDDNEISNKVEKINKKRFVIQMIIFVIITVITFAAYLYLKIMKPSYNNTVISGIMLVVFANA